MERAEQCNYALGRLQDFMQLEDKIRLGEQLTAQEQDEQLLLSQGKFFQMPEPDAPLHKPLTESQILARRIAETAVRYRDVPDDLFKDVIVPRLQKAAAAEQTPTHGVRTLDKVERYFLTLGCELENKTREEFKPTVHSGYAAAEQADARKNKANLTADLAP